MILRTHGLHKAYGAHVALNGVDLEVADGTVYGLVGPNGAGKTTLLALVSGLRRPTAGTVAIGVERRHMAVLPDTPQFEPWLTAREVVDLAGRLLDAGLAGDRVDEVLAQVGLAEAAGRRVGGFSRGMLQRLGLAAAVVGRPALLLLDEPCSALDPAGRKDVLDLVAELGRSSTVLLSTHILADVQRVARDVGVLRHGRLLYQGPLDRLLARHARAAYAIRIRPPADGALSALRAQPWVTGVEESAPDEWRVSVRALADAEEKLAAVLAAAGARVVSTNPVEADLESVFLELTG